MLDPRLLAKVEQVLAPADALLATYPGARLTRQPVHTLYLPAPRFTADWVPGAGAGALLALEQHIGDSDNLADLLAVPVADKVALWKRVRAKLQGEPVEDLRIDFEDGYGSPDDATEDADTVRAVNELSESLTQGSTPPWVGLRLKSLEPATRMRGLRTLAMFVSLLSERTSGLAGAKLAGFNVTLPKVTSPAQVEAMMLVCQALEADNGLADGFLQLELQVELPQAVLGSDGAATVAAMLTAGAGRVSGLHFGTYDYSAALGIAGAYQALDHPVADHAKAVMQVAAAQREVWVCDGSTNILPLGRPPEMRAAWRVHAQLVQRSLARGFYQGWDLHPHQLITRYAATFAFFAAGLPATLERLNGFVSQREGGILDEPATAAALAAYVCRALSCGAIDEVELAAATKLTPADLAALSQRLPLPQ